MTVLPEDWTLPQPNDITRDWFTSGSIAVQTCGSCGLRQHPPEEICSRCGAMEFTSTTLGPGGTVYSYTVAHYPVNRTLADAVPYAVVLVELDDDPEIRVVGNVVGVDAAEVHIGMAVTATWETRQVGEDEIALLLWEPT